MSKMLMWRCNLFNLFFKILILSILVSLWGCASVVSVPPDTSELQQVQKKGLSSTKGWWHARFQIDWPEAKEPNWYWGTLLAGEVIAPALQQYRNEIQVWRFHRRAVRDGHGHVFSFIFFSSAQTAQTVYNAIEQDPLLISLRQEKKIMSVGFDNVDRVKKPGIAATSDRKWPEMVQKSWPVFIMGASQMWLDMVLELASDRGSEQDIEVLYQDVQKQISSIWMDYGRHAWLHHLNGVFAYQPMLIRY